MKVPVALSIAGSDPSGGAGIQADLKTFAAFGVYGAAALTSLTAQNTRGVSAVAELEPGFVRQQIEAVLSDLRVGAVKLGMLSRAAIVEAVAEALGPWPGLPVVLDPVMLAKGGAALLMPDAVAVLRERLLPRAALITPNLPEAAALLSGTRQVGQKSVSEARVAAEPEWACEQLLGLGAQAVLLKGGHGSGAQSTDILAVPREGAGGRPGLTRLSLPRLPTRNTHGTGCTLSAAIAAGLAHGRPLEQAVRDAKDFVQGALAAADSLAVTRDASEAGDGHGPLHHLFSGGHLFP